MRCLVICCHIFDLLPQLARLAKETRTLEKSKTWGEKDLGKEALRDAKLRALVSSVVPFIPDPTCSPQLYQCASSHPQSIYHRHTRYLASRIKFGHRQLERRCSRHHRASAPLFFIHLRPLTGLSLRVVTSVMALRKQWEAAGGKK